MYYAGQIVWSLTAKKPIKTGHDVECGGSWAGHPNGHQTTHFIKDYEYPDGKRHSHAYHAYDLALPMSVEEAELLMERGLIFPAPCPVTHHWRCRNWKSNCRCEDKS